MDWQANHGISVGGNLTNNGAMAGGHGASANVYFAPARDPRPTMPALRIFINYRSGDDPGTAMLLKQELSRHFGEDNVFIDKSGIPPGNDFERELLSRVRRSDVVLAIIGPRWLTASHSTGGRAIEREDDWVRRELAEAFANGVRVVPVLVNDTARLTGATLPDDVAPLTKCQYLTLRHGTFEYDLTRIVDQLVKLPNAVTPREPEVT